ncbi:MAG TPA: peptide chain release factor N(5)-glutamine methyltransferase [Candidatus Limnocylindrales bacterium]|nr:peptide chain release factor N(5)-glutamine methyltransferase [Candidatus Limnocylindrales bacterium]
MATSGEALEDAIARLAASGSETARLDAEVLLSHTLGIDRSTLLANPAAPVGPGAADRFEEAVRRREAGEPVAYIWGLKEFFGIALAVDSRALIPRPETERLVEAVVREVMARLTAPGRSFEDEPIRVADVGTGSGAVAIAVAVELRRRRVPVADVVRILATDLWPDALDLARENAVAHAVADTLEFATADLLPPDLPAHRRFDVIAANLPYVRSGAIAGLPIAASFEPRAALDGGEDGLDVIRALLLRLPEALADDGVALFEIGGDQGVEAPAAAGLAVPGWSATVENDLGGLPRVLRVSR